MANKRGRVMMLALTLGALSLLACGTGLSAASPTPPGGGIKVSSLAADELERNVRNQLFDPTKKDFRISLTNQQATSYSNLRTMSVPLEKPQIWFTQGKAFIRGTFVGICLFHPDVLIVAVPKVKEKMILVNIQQIYVGSFALPQDWIATVSKSATDSIEEAQINLDFERLEILEGELVLSGSKRAN
ncbi:MAG: hypothetical protein ABI874_13650 [Chloroflexota bacterium]